MSFKKHFSFPELLHCTKGKSISLYCLLTFSTYSRNAGLLHRYGIVRPESGDLYFGSLYHFLSHHCLCNLGYHYQGISRVNYVVYSNKYARGSIVIPLEYLMSYLINMQLKKGLLKAITAFIEPCTVNCYFSSPTTF